MGAVLAGATQIIAIDKVEAKGDIALSFGATHIVMAGPHAVRDIRKLTEGRGADYTFEAVGHPNLQIECFEAARPGGTVCFVGMTKAGRTANLDGPILIRQEKTILGSFYGSAHNPTDFNHYCDLNQRGDLPIDRLITHRYHLNEINQAIEDMLSGKVGRGVIIFE